MRYFLMIVFVGSVFFSKVIWADPFQDLVVTCTVCHGEKGVSINDLWPNISGQKEEYLVKQLKDFREERRIDPMMNPITQNLSDEDIKKLAQYFSSIK